MRKKTLNEKEKKILPIIDNWLIERNSLICCYFRLGTQKINYHKQNHNIKHLNKHLKTLSQILIDYISAGHFEVYEKIQTIYEQQNSNKDSKKNLEDLYKKIYSNTYSCIAFNDKYDKTTNVLDMHNALSYLGESLADRFDAEDKLLNIINYYENFK